jgi:long-subunit fatty acid transport protein
MNTLARTLAIIGLVALVPARLFAGGKDDLAPTVAPPATNNIPISQEFEIEGAYDSGSELKQGNAHIGSSDVTYGHADYVISPQVTDAVLLRFGLDAERFSFGLPNQAPLPNTLQSVNAIIGADFAVNDKIIVRAELHPGIYSDFVSVGGSDFDMPVQIGGTYLWNKNFQIIFGLQIDVKSDLPVIGLPGFRWQFADKWVLSAIPPKPQLQYLLTKDVTLYAGAEILGGTYHLNDTFGSNHGHPASGVSNNSNLNSNIADYGEFRVGLGVTWKFAPNLSLDVNGGYVPYREYDIHPDRFGYNTHSTIFHNNIGAGGGYGEVGLSGSF